MPQQIIDRSRNEFIASMLLGKPNLMDLYSVDAQTIGGTDRAKNGVIIIQNNQIFITPPLSGGMPAVISAVHPVVLKLNGQLLTEPTPITSADDLTWEICEKPQYQITVSDDKLKVYFTLYRAERYAWNLVNTPASTSVTVRAEMNRDSLISILSIAQIMAGFEKSSFIGSLNIPAIYEELNNPTYLPVCIAEGKAPVPGTNARLEVLHQNKIENEFKGTGLADEDYPRGAFINVQEGEVFAQKMPPQEGLPGFNVFGGVLPPPPPQDLTLITGHYAALLPDGQIVARCKGRPRITGNGTFVKTIDFPQTYVVPQSDTPEAATIRFAGDVFAAHPLNKHTVIEALGNVYIYGDIHNSRIAATGSIFIRGMAVDSELYAGAFGAAHHHLCRFSELLIQEVSSLREAAKNLAETVESTMQTVNYGLVVMLLLESKYHHLPLLIGDMREFLSGISPDYPQDTKILRHMMGIFLKPGQFSDLITDAGIGSFLSLLHKLIEGVSLMQEENVRIDISGAQNSIIKSSGAIYIHGEGISRSTLCCSGDIYFVKNGSLCSDSTMEAEGTITAQNVSGEHLPGSLLVAGQQITASTIHNASVTIDGYSLEIAEPGGDTTFTAKILKQKCKESGSLSTE
ncbi:flagellar assembly protein A [Paenibacillus sp. sgz5001063]|uniref:flagellar assembly protein A n=1 Tax=Paenibacillus sp. sgz5001063 TaxID=3242474 RepID=UPI0036D43D99